MEYIIVSESGGIGSIVMNRVASYNSMTLEMSLEIQEQLTKWTTDNRIRVISLSANGKGFCTGQDLKEATAPDAMSLKESIDVKYNPLIKLIVNMPKPVVALVNGIAAGAGANIALACDIVIAKQSAKFIQVFSNIGLVPDCGGSYFLPRSVGYQKALAITLLGDHISATEAEQMGMIYKVIEDEHWQEETHKLLERMAQMPTLALALTKKLMQDGMSNTLEEQLMLERTYQDQASKSYDSAEGINAFLEKRKPIFKGN